jgi:hypothetical protein
MTAASGLVSDPPYNVAIRPALMNALSLSIGAAETLSSEAKTTWSKLSFDTRKSIVFLSGDNSQ